MVALLLDAVSMAYPSGAGLDHLSLRVEEGEAVTLLGASGSGKTTALRVIAGLEKPDSGDVLFDGIRVNDVSPAERDLAMVFQDNVLFPFMDVRHNVAFPLEIRHVPEAEIARRVEAETRATRIAGLLERKPHELSAGEQQLAQIARAMVRRPGVFLIDEPFGRLDPITTRRMRAELKLMQQGYAVTTVYATHDYEDAMVMSDRIVVLDEGRVLQIEEPMAIYERPAHLAVATLFGGPPMALIASEVEDGVARIGELAITTGDVRDGSVVVGVRPEHWTVSKAGLSGEVGRTYNDGDHDYATISTIAGAITIRNDQGVATGERIHLRPDHFHVFDAETGWAVHHSR